MCGEQHLSVGAMSPISAYVLPGKMELYHNDCVQHPAFTQDLSHFIPTFNALGKNIKHFA